LPLCFRVLRQRNIVLFVKGILQRLQKIVPYLSDGKVGSIRGALFVGFLRVEETKERNGWDRKEEQEK